MKTKLKINNNGDAILSFNESIYPCSLIEQAADAFKKQHNIKFSNSSIKISSQDKEENEKLAYEFFNYLIALKQNEN